MKKALLPLLAALFSISATYANEKSLPYEIVAIYDGTDSDVSNYYLILSDNEAACYNHRTSTLDITSGFVLSLDLYNEATDPISLPAGTYNPCQPGTESAPGEYDPEFSEISYYDEGEVVATSPLTSPIEVSLVGDNRYSISVVAKHPMTKDDFTLTFTGRLPFIDSSEKPASFPMLKRDLDVQLGGGIAFYQGVSDLSNQGVTYLNLYQGEYDANGALVGNGINLAMMIAHKRIAKASDYRLIPGTYTNASTLARDTWYPCREIDYPVGNETISMPFGSFIRVRENGEYVYGYLASGTFELKVEDGVAIGTLDAVTNLGYSVKATFRGEVSLNTDNATFKATVSDLTDDVEMDFSKLEKGRIWHTGLTGGCRTFVVDLGSPAGRDEAINHGGDLLRMEFLSPVGDAVLKPGVYTVVPRRWNSNELAAGGTYDPMSLNKGYFSVSGDQTGTRYAHFRNGSYCVYDMVGPAEEGTVTVETTDFENYTFHIDLIDDAGYIMSGLWDNKPIEYFYDADALKNELGEVSITDIFAGDESRISVYVEGHNVIVLNGGDAPVRITDINGRTVATGKASEAINVSDLNPNIYILFINNKSFKLAL